MPKSEERIIELENLYDEGGDLPPSPPIDNRPNGRIGALGRNLRGILLLIVGYYAITYGVIAYHGVYKWGNDQLNGVINRVIEAKLGSFELRTNGTKPIGLSDMDRDTLEKQMVLISGQYKQCLEAQEEIRGITGSFAGRLYGE